MWTLKSQGAVILARFGNSARTKLRHFIALPAVGALVAGLGLVATAGPAAAAPGAVVDLAGCAANILPRNDDGSTGVVELPFNLNFYGEGYDKAFVNNNGNITFDAPLGTYTPFGLVATYRPIIAPFFADVDTRGGEGQVTYGNTSYDGHDAFCVSWPAVGYFPNQVDKLNTFQLLLVDRPDRGNADFDIVYNYDAIAWETGSASGGNGGLGGSSAVAGFSSGTGTEATSYEFAGSGVNGALLDSNTATGLANNNRGSTVLGRYVFAIRNGSPNYILRQPDELFGVRPVSYYVNDPINTATGNLVNPVVDIDAAGGQSGFDLARTYNSLDSRVSDFGTGWSSMLGIRVDQRDGGTVELTDTDGRTVPFVPTGTGWSLPEDFTGTLTQAPDGRYEILFVDGGKWGFDAAGNLDRTSDWTGRSSTIEHDTAGRVSAIVQSTGPALRFERDSAGNVTTATSSDGRIARYTYEGEHLVTATDIGGTATGYTYDSAGHLLTETGPDGRLVMTNTFDLSGRVLSQTTVGAAVTFLYDDIDGITTVHDARTGEDTRFAHDTDGHPVTLTDAAGRISVRGYDDAGNLTSSTDRTDATTQVTYDAQGNLLTSTDANGASANWDYDNAGRVITHTDESGARTTFGYTGSERIASQTTTADGAVTTTEIEAGLVQTITDPDGVRQGFIYDEQGNLSSLVDGVGGITAFTRDTAGRVLTETTPAGRTTSYTYDSRGRTTGISDGAGSRAFTFDAVGNLLTETGPAGGQNTYAYDPQGRLIASTNALGETARTTYDDAGRVASTTGPRGDTTTYAYGPLGRVEAVTDPTGGVTRYTYDPTGRATTVTDPNGRTTSQEVDVLGRITATTDPAGAVNRYEYDALGNVVTSIDASGGRTVATYDVVGRPALVTGPTGGTSSTTWTPGGRIAATTDATGVAMTFTYDPAGRQASSTDALGGTAQTTYDADGLVQSETSPGGRSVRYAYDDAGRLTKTTHPDGSAQTRELDAAGNLTSLVNPDGGRSTFAYDAAGQLTTATDPLGATTAYTRTGGLVDATTDATGSAELRTYDLAGRIVTLTDRAGQLTRYGYDAAGQLTSVADPTGRTENRQYDPAGRMTARTYGDGTAVTYAYDATGLRTSMTDTRGTTTYAYDPAGHLTRQTGPDSTVQAWAYDLAGRKTAMTYPDGNTLTQTYDAAGRLVGASHPSWGTASWILDPDGLVITESLPAGQSRTFTYDSSGQTSAITQSIATPKDRRNGASGSRSAADRHQPESGPETCDSPRNRNYHAETCPRSTVRLTRDPAGRVTGTTTTGGRSTGNANYGYDEAGQLTSAQTHDQDPATPYRQSWTLDSTGSRTATAVNGAVTDYKYDDAHRLASTTTHGVKTTYTYDAAGRRTTETSRQGTVTYAYDGAGRLARTTTTEGRVTTAEDRAYDGDGMLVGYNVTRDKKSAATKLAWDITGATPELVTTSTGTQSRSFVNGRRGAVGVAREDGSTAVFAKDAFGSIISTPQTADVVSASSYSPYGQASVDHSCAGLPITPTLGYRGGVTLGATNYLIERTYDPQTGQFLSADPITQPAGTATATNEYAYAANDPLSRIDPLGLSPVSDGGINGFGLAGLIGASTPLTPDISEWSSQHRAVQLHFAAVKRPGTALEVPIPGSSLAGGLGRADLVSGLSVWEVKTARWEGVPALRLSALNQLDRYVVGLTALHGMPFARGQQYGTYTVPYAPGQIVVQSYAEPGMLWYYYRSGTGRVPVRVPVPVPVPILVPVPNPAPAPVRAPTTGWEPPGWLKPVVVGGAVIVGGALILATLAEDILTVGVGIADDPFTIGAGLGLIGWGAAAY